MASRTVGPENRFGDRSQFRGRPRQTSPVIWAILIWAIFPASYLMHRLAALRDRVFSLLPLQNLALGQNELDLAEAFDW